MTCCVSLSGSDQVSHRLPVLSTCLPLPHQDVAPQHLWGDVSHTLILFYNQMWCHFMYLITIFNISPLTNDASYNKMSLFPLILEWRCVYFYIAPSSGWPAERRVAFREVESHPECPVSTSPITSFQMSLLSGILPSLSSLNHFTDWPDSYP